MSVCKNNFVIDSFESMTGMKGILDDTGFDAKIKNYVTKILRKSKSINETKWIEEFVWQQKNIGYQECLEFADFYKKVSMDYYEHYTVVLVEEDLPQLAGVFEIVFEYIFFWDKSIDLDQKILDTVLPTAIDQSQINYFCNAIKHRIQEFRLLTELRGHRSLKEMVRDIKLQMEHVVEIKSKLNDIEKLTSVSFLVLDYDFIQHQYITQDEATVLLKRFYHATDQLEDIAKVICNRLDIVNESAMRIARQCLSKNNVKPFIITGNGGTGKTVLMMQLAIDAVFHQYPVFWIRFQSCNCREEQIEQMFQAIKNIATAYEKTIYICIDHPFVSPDTLRIIQDQLYYHGETLQLIVAERLDRLNIMFDQNNDVFPLFTEDSNVLCLGKEGATKNVWWFNSVHTVFEPLDIEWRKKVIACCVHSFFSQETACTKSIDCLISKNESYIKNGDISLVELEYQMLYELQQQKDTTVVMRKTSMLDWDEWRNILSYRNIKPRASFECIAVLYLFKVPVDIDTLANCLELSKLETLQFIMENFTKELSEPIFVDDEKCIHLKHDMVAELFFHFHPKQKQDIYTLFEYTIQVMSDVTLVKFCDLVFRKKLILGLVEAPLGIEVSRLVELCWNNVKTSSSLSENGREEELKLAVCWVLQKKGQFEEAVELMEELYLLKGIVHPRVIHELGRLYQKFQRMEEAKNLYETAVTKIKNDSLLLMDLGTFYRDNRNYEGARQCFQQAIQQNPRQISYYHQLAKLESECGNYDEAYDLFAYILSENDEHIHTMLELGRLELRLHHVEEARAWFERILDIAPYNTYALNELGKLEMNQNNFVRAKYLLRTAKELDPSNVYIRNQLGQLYDRMKFYEQAEKELACGLEIDPNNVKLLNEYSKVLIHKKCYVEAKECLKKALCIKPNDVYLVNALFRLYNRQDNELAGDLLKKYWDLFKQDYYFLYECYVYYYKHGDQKDANECRNKILHMNPDAKI